jgi:hypothetical protein
MGKMIQTHSLSRILGALLCGTLLVGLGPISSVAQAPAPASTPKAAPLKAEQLEQLVAPIALYPDALLAQVLMASTYPFEIVQAARWQKANKGKTGKALEDALQPQTWEPSVKSLVAVPQVLLMMDEKLEWVQPLGDAFLAQREGVMEAVQRLRAKAAAAGQLKTTKEQKVVTQTVATKTVYVIEPTNPQVVYVPVYNPTVVYGAWAYPAYPPHYYYPPGYVAGTALAFTAGVAVGAALWGNCNWGNNNVNININNFNSYNRTNIIARGFHIGTLELRSNMVVARRSLIRGKSFVAARMPTSAALALNPSIGRKTGPRLQIDRRSGPPRRTGIARIRAAIRLASIDPIRRRPGRQRITLEISQAETVRSAISTMERRHVRTPSVVEQVSAAAAGNPSIGQPCQVKGVAVVPSGARASNSVAETKNASNIEHLIVRNRGNDHVVDS